MRILRAGGGLIAAAVLLSALALPALAQPHDRGHERHARRHVEHRPPPPPSWGYEVPSYVETPPPLVYAPPPPPPLVYPAPGLTFNFTFR